jgi:hypothetical protein
MEKLVVRTEFRNLSIYNHCHAVGVVGGVEPVGNCNYRSTLQDGRETSFEMAGCAGIQHGGRFVEHQRVRVGQDESR